MIKKYFCSFRNFRTDKKYNLEMHKKNKHGTSQTGSGALLSDDQCSYSSSRKYELKRHERLKHYQKKFKCLECSREFTRRNHLKRHIKKHSNKNEKQDQ